MIFGKGTSEIGGVGRGSPEAVVDYDQVDGGCWHDGGPTLRRSKVMDKDGKVEWNCSKGEG